MESKVKIAFFDPFSGAAGDMVLGALLDAGLDFPALEDGLTSLGLDGYTLESSPVNHHGISGTHFAVKVAQSQPQRDWASIRPLIENSGLPGTVRDRALQIFAQLAEAEANVHGTSVESVHFHEVGAVDAIVDICGFALAMDLMEIDEVYSLPPAVGQGWIRAQHGLMPVPAPATAQLLTTASVPLGRPMPDQSVENVELLTPTGAAILVSQAIFEQPVFSANAIGYGFGSKQLPWPNALRVWIGETTAST